MLIIQRFALIYLRMKRKTLLPIILLICTTAITAQDVITLKTGEEISSRVQEISTTEIKFKKTSNPNGPIYTIKKADVFMIKYENGEKDILGFDETEATATKTTNSTSKSTAQKPTKKVDHNLNLIFRGFPVGGGDICDIFSIDYNPLFNITQRFSIGPGVGLGATFLYDAANFALPLYARAQYKFLTGKITPYVSGSIVMIAEFGESGAGAIGTFTPVFGCQISKVNISAGYDLFFNSYGHASGFNVSLGYRF